MAKNSGQYPDSYGKNKGGALPDILGPLNVESEGDKLVPQNDMGEVGGAMCDGAGSPDPLDLVYIIEKDGAKGKR